MNFYFYYPKFLYLLFLIPIMFLVYFFNFNHFKKRTILFSNFEAIERIFGVEFFSKSLIVFFMEVLILVSIILSLTQPILITDMRTSEFSYVILLDNSYSMEVNDVGMRRIDLAKKIARNFVNSLPYGSESALVTFAGDVKIIKGMDASSIRTYLSIDSIDISHVDGSNILNAIVSSSSLFGSREKKAILLISDGEFGMENLTNVLGFIEANNIKVDSILVGGEGGTDSLGRFHKTNKENLKALSTNSKGKFYAAEEVNFDSLISESTREVHLDLSYYFLLLSLIIFSLLWFLKNLGFLPS